MDTNTDQLYEDDFPKTENDFRFLMEARDVLYQRVNHILWLVGKYTSDETPCDCEDCDQITFGNDHIFFEWRTYYSCCGYGETDYHEFKMPIEYMWMPEDQLEELLKEKQRIEREEREAKAKQEALRKQAIKDERDYEKFKELQERFG